MAPGPLRKLAIFTSVIFILAGVATAIPDEWVIGSPACHTCHEASKPVDHLVYRLNYMGYNSLCSFAPFSTLALLLIGCWILLSSYGFRPIRWGKEYRSIAPAICVALALITAIPFDTGYQNLLGWNTLCPLFPLSTAILSLIGAVAFYGLNVCPALAFWRHRCPILDTLPDVTNSPHRNVWRFLKVVITGKLNEAEVERLYRCTLCGGCLLSYFARGARKAAVSHGINPAHLTRIKDAISSTGNPYGIAPALKDGSGFEEKSDTILFMGCTGRYRTPEMLAAAEKLLKKKGIIYFKLEDETCCGSTLFNMGDVAGGNSLVDRNVKKFKAAGVKRIITICPGCYTTLNMHYKINGFSPEVVLALDLFKDMKAEAKGVVIHDPCHAKEKKETVRKMLPGAAEEPAGACCGAGGGVMALDGELSVSRARLMLEGQKSIVVTYCPFCYLNLSRANADKVTDIYQYMAGEDGR